jgi:hypothetical protein
MHGLISEIGGVLVKIQLQIDPPYIDVISIDSDQARGESQVSPLGQHTGVCDGMQHLVLGRGDCAMALAESTQGRDDFSRSQRRLQFPNGVALRSGVELVDRGLERSYGGISMN